jgi:hypothetical protein
MSAVFAVLAVPPFRPDDAEFPLFLHIVGATILVGGVLTSGSALAFAKGDAKLLRLGYWSLLAVSLPGWIIMRAGAHWIASKEGWDDVDDPPRWLDIGYVVADAGGVVLLIALVAGGIGVYRMREGTGAGLLKVTMALAFILLAAYVVAAWAMAGKPN